MSGTINYTTGRVTLTSWSGVRNNNVVVESLLSKRATHSTATVSWRVPSAPLVPESLQISAVLSSGESVTARADVDGNIVSNHIKGAVQYDSGVVLVLFGNWVDVTPEIQAQWWFDANDVKNGQIFQSAPVIPESITYNATAYSFLPLDAAQLGIDPVRLPPDGRVQFVKQGDLFVLSDEQEMQPATVSNNQTLNTGRTRLSRVRVVASNGVGINSGYSVDLDAGTVKFTDVADYVQPVTVKHYVEDLLQVVDVQIDGTVSFASPITHAYPIGSWGCSALYFGDQFARVSRVFDQMSWGGTEWADVTVGNQAVASYNTAISPITVTNAGAITERWALKFVNNSEVDVIGEHVGNLGRFSINAEIAPANPNATGNAPYFRLPAIGWGAGWVGGNVLFVHTVGAMADAWLLQCVNKGASAVLDTSFEVVARGNVDRPGADQT